MCASNIVSSFFWKYPEIKGSAVISSYYFKLIKEVKPQQMFWYACNLLKMDAYSTGSQQCFKQHLP